MNLMSPCKIFLSDNRSTTENKHLRSARTDFYSTKSSGVDVLPGKLFLLNDELLAGGCETILNIDRNARLIILPVTGDIDLKLTAGQACSVTVEEVLMVTVAAGGFLLISNPYASEVINYLVLGIECSELYQENQPGRSRFKTNHKNELQKLLSDEESFELSIGVFDGRGEAFKPLKTDHSVFAFVIAGAFEMEGRLLHERDGLLISSTRKAEIEALSNNAFILLIEMKTTNGIQ